MGTPCADCTGYLSRVSSLGDEVDAACRRIAGFTRGVARANHAKLRADFHAKEKGPPTMRILVIGASQGTGALAVRTALERGHDVTAFARSPQKLALEHPRLTRRQGDFHQQASVEAAVRGHDAVVVTASATSLGGFKENPHYFSQGTRYVVDAMKASGARRVVVLSALGTGESRKLANFLVDKLLISWLLKLPFADHERQEALLRESGLDWVIARPGRLTNGPARKQYVKRTEIVPVPGSISRADVADFLVEATEVDQWVGKAVQLGG
jgi:uncharacterized protein YbjT (DUF2867 family)